MRVYNNKGWCVERWRLRCYWLFGFTISNSKFGFACSVTIGNVTAEYHSNPRVRKVRNAIEKALDES